MSHAAADPDPGPFDDVKTAIVLMRVTSKKMRLSINDYENKTHYSGGTCDHKCAVSMRCTLNHFDEQLTKLYKKFCE